MKVLGINAAGGKLWLSLVDEDGVLEAEPSYLELHEGTQAGYALTAFRDECVHALTALTPDRAVILDMESVSTAPVSAMRSRFTGEAVLALCAAGMGVTCLRLNRATVRSRLGLPRTGALVDHVTRVFETPVGKHWTKKRDLGALAARAEIVGG